MKCWKDVVCNEQTKLFFFKTSILNKAVYLPNHVLVFSVLCGRYVSRLSAVLLQVVHGHVPVSHAHGQHVRMDWIQLNKKENFLLLLDRIDFEALKFRQLYFIVQYGVLNNHFVESLICLFQVLIFDQVSFNVLTLK